MEDILVETPSMGLSDIGPQAEKSVVQQGLESAYR
jgi:hypothetical protein